jgi:hypothetical protein
VAPAALRWARSSRFRCSSPSCRPASRAPSRHHADSRITGMR